MTNKPRIIQQWSGSLLCAAGLYFARKDFEVICLVNFRGALEAPRIIEQISVDILRSLSDSLALPLFTPYSSSAYIEGDFKSLVSLMKKKYSVESLGMSFCKEDLAMSELKEKYESCEMQVLNFIDNQNAIELYKEILELGFKAHILSVNEKSLDRRFIGAPLNLEILKTFQEQNIHPFGTNGEFETICTDGPIFKEGLSLNFGDVHSKQDVWFREVFVPA